MQASHELTTVKAQQHRRDTLRPHPKRNAIIDAMTKYGGPISPTRLAEITGQSLGSTAYHVRTLLAAGVVELADEGRVRGAVEHFYALVADHAAELNDPLVGLQTICGALTQPDLAGGYPRTVELDAAARADLQKVLDSIRPRVERIVSQAARRSDR